MKKALIGIFLVSCSMSFSANAGVLEDIASFFGFSGSDKQHSRVVKPRPPREW